MSKETETIHFDEKEYRQLEAIAKKTGFKNVDELVNTALKEFVESELIKKEEVKIKISKKLLAFVYDQKGEGFKEYLSNLLTDSIAADIEAEVFGEDPDQIKKDYDLTEEWQFYQGH